MISDFPVYRWGRNPAGVPKPSVSVQERRLIRMGIWNALRHPRELTVIRDLTRTASVSFPWQPQTAKKTTHNWAVLSTTNMTSTSTTSSSSLCWEPPMKSMGTNQFILYFIHILGWTSPKFFHVSCNFKTFLPHGFFFQKITTFFTVFKTEWS